MVRSTRTRAACGVSRGAPVWLGGVAWATTCPAGHDGGNGANDDFFIFLARTVSFTFLRGYWCFKHRVKTCAHVSRQWAAHTRTRAMYACTPVVFTTDK